MAISSLESSDNLTSQLIDKTLIGDRDGKTFKVISEFEIPENYEKIERIVEFILMRLRSSNCSLNKFSCEIENFLSKTELSEEERFYKGLIEEYYSERGLNKNLCLNIFLKTAIKKGNIKLAIDIIKIFENLEDNEYASFLTFDIMKLRSGYRFQIAKALIEKNVNFNCFFKKKFQLVDSTSLIKRQSLKFQTPLSMAICNYDNDLVELLMENGAKVSSIGLSTHIVKVLNGVTLQIQEREERSENFSYLLRSDFLLNNHIIFDYEYFDITSFSYVNERRTISCFSSLIFENI